MKQQTLLTVFGTRLINSRLLWQFATEGDAGLGDSFPEGLQAEPDAQPMLAESLLHLSLTLKQRLGSLINSPLLNKVNVIPLWQKAWEERTRGWAAEGLF